MAQRVPQPIQREEMLRNAVRSGSLASLFSMVPLLLLGRKATGHWTPVPNAISHWLWGRSALHKHGATFRHTFAGVFIHHMASIFWATFFCRWCATADRNVGGKAVSIALAACLVDFKMTPQRLTPGFEHHLSKKDLAIVYSCFAAGLALGFKAKR